MLRKDYLATEAAAVTKSDDTVFAPSVLFVGGAGNVVVQTQSGEDATFTGVPAGTILPLLVKKVKAATTATNITRMY